MPVDEGTVYIETAAGHRLRHAGKGKGRVLICERCGDRLRIVGDTLEEAAANLAELLANHGGPEECP